MKTAELMPVLVKICGINMPDALDAAVEAGADALGFVFFPPSPRHLGIEAASALAERVGGRAAKVALTVDAEDALLAAIRDAVKPDMLQLHGQESPARVAAIRTRFGLPVMKALPVETRADLSAVSAYAQVADRILFDARPPREATRPGGLGAPFDWRILEDLHLPLPFTLSGGLDAGNVARAIRIARPGGVDVSSGVERAPGDKDPGKIGAFIRAAREAADTPDRIVTSA